MRYIFFRKDLAEIKEPDNGVIASINASYEYKIFKPTWFQLTTKGMSINLASILWALLYLVIWKRQGKDYAHHLVYHGERLIHYSVVLPKYYRFPFMGNNDIHIGLYWTAEEYRGQGICLFIIHSIMNKHKFRKRYAYVMILENNVASQRSVTKAGLNICGHGIRTRGFFGKFILQADAER